MRLPQRAGGLSLLPPVERREQLQGEAEAQARPQLEQLLRRGAQAAQLAEQEVDDVVRDLGGPDPLHVPRPPAGGRVKPQQTTLVQAEQELVYEKGIALGLIPHKLRQLGRRAAFLIQRLVEQRLYCIARERPERELGAAGSGLPQYLYGQGQRVRVVQVQVLALVWSSAAVRSDDQEVTAVRTPQELLQKLQRGLIYPVQIIEEQDQRRLSGKDAHEALNGQHEAGLRFGRAHLGKGRLRTEHAIEDTVILVPLLGHAGRVEQKAHRSAGVVERRRLCDIAARQLHIIRQQLSSSCWIGPLCPWRRSPGSFLSASERKFTPVVDLFDSGWREPAGAAA